MYIVSRGVEIKKRKGLAMTKNGLFETYRINVTNEARKLAKTYYEYVTKVLDRRVKWDRATSMIENWAKDFDGYARETKVPYSRLMEVLDWYIKTNDPRRYTYPCPIAFLDHFRTLEQRWQWSYRPIPADELTPITDKLLQEKWPGNVDDLITVVSKSVHAVRTILSNIPTTIPDLVAKGINRSIPTVNGYVIDHFTQWRRRHNNTTDAPLWTAEISENLVLDSFCAEWKKMGFGANECQRFREAILTECRKR